MPDASTLTVDVRLDPAGWAAHLAEQTAAGLADVPPWMPPVWFYDDRGSELFDEITRLPEYYPTRAERTILRQRAGEIAALTGASTLVELGSGTSDKTRLLLDALEASGALERFVPVDCSEATLRYASAVIAADRPGLEVHAVVGDFHRHLGAVPRRGRHLVAFLGGTIGNLDPGERSAFLAEVAAAMDDGDSFLMGADLVKDPARLVAAYDDAAGVTAEFNRNALRVINRELGADARVEAYDHVAHWDPVQRWIEMRLVARSPQLITVAGLDGLRVELDAGQWLRTEISAKLTTGEVRDELRAAGMTIVAQWVDPAHDFLLTLGRAG